MRGFQSKVCRPEARGLLLVSLVGNSAFRKQQLGGCLAWLFFLFIFLINFG